MKFTNIVKSKKTVARQSSRLVKPNRLVVAIRQAFYSMAMSGCLMPGITVDVMAAGPDDLPVECGVCNGSSFVTNPAFVDVIRNNAVMDINQKVPKLTLNWQGFNIGSNATVNFNQPDRNAIVLNRIFQESPSEIFGALNANGTVYLINQNGILFGEGAQVNVHTLTASSLNITDEVFDNGILRALQDDSTPAFEPFDSGVSQNIEVASGAELHGGRSGAGGGIFIFAPDIKNSGIITAADGQVMLAAGQKVYLQASNNPELRGLLVEVDSGGEVLNLNEIITERGNVTLLGKAVNQNGRVTATTSVSSNGSIRLIARDTSTGLDLSTNFMSATQAGTVELGEDSVTQILAELDSQDMAVDSQEQIKSSVEIMGRQIHLKANSVIEARGGEVSIIAVNNPAQTVSDTNPLVRDDTVRVQMDAGSRIDVSGYALELPMERNELEVELRGNEFADMPLQKDGVLRGQKVIIDPRRASEFKLANISGYLDTINRGVAERLSVGGKVTFLSEGEIRLLDGAGIDVSGGYVNYTPGMLRTTLLEAGFGQFDINTASPDRVYSGLKTLKFRAPGDVQGSDAGSVQLIAGSMVNDATLTGHSVAGRYQRTSGTRPDGGKLVIGFSRGQQFTLGQLQEGLAPGSTVSNLDSKGELIPGFNYQVGQGFDNYLAPNITLQDSRLADMLGIAGLNFDQSLTQAGLSSYTDELVLSTDFLTRGGFTRAELQSDGQIHLMPGPDLELLPLAKLSASAYAISIDRSVSSLSGQFSFTAVNINAPVVDVPGLSIANNVTLDVSGGAVNDDPRMGSQMTSPLLPDGGSITLRSNVQYSVGAGVPIGAPLYLGDSVALLALGGTIVTRDSRDTNASFGEGGDISIIASMMDTAIHLGRDNLYLGHSGAKGGTLTITANGISIEPMSPGDWRAGQTVDPAGVLRLPDFLFDESGFSSFRLTANQGDLTIAPGAVLDVKTASLFLPVRALQQVNVQITDLLTEIAGDGFDALNTSDFVPTRDAMLTSGWLNDPDNTLAWLRGDDFLGYQPAYAREAADIDLTISTSSIDFELYDLDLASSSVLSVDPGASINLTNRSGGLINLAGTINAEGAERITLELSKKPEQAFDNINDGISHAIILGSQGVINAGAAFELAPSPSNYQLYTGTLFDAADISMQSSGMIMLNPGSRIDVSGVAETLDYLNLVPQQLKTSQLVTANAGSLTLAAAEGIVLDGDFTAYAATVNGTGGSLTLDMDQQLRSFSALATGVPQVPTRVILRQTGANEPVENGQVIVSADKLAASGIDQLALRARGEAGRPGIIDFEGNVNLSLRRDIVLDAPVIRSDSGEAALNANYIAIGTDSLITLNGYTATGGGGSLIANAKHIDVRGNTLLQGFADVSMISSGDIRLTGVGNARQGLTGEFSMLGNLVLEADQVYPSTLTTFEINAGQTGSITILPSGEGGRVLSAGGEITLRAGDIRQQGSLLAPLGRIRLDAENTLLFGDGTITSVSAAGEAIPLGQVLNGLQWSYTTSEGLNDQQTGYDFADVTDLYSKVIQNVPEKVIELNAASINIAAGAKIDLSGGGNLVTWEFVPGPGGSRDALLAMNAGDSFAIIPGLGSGFAPIDPQMFRGWDIPAARGVFLEQTDILAAGFYTVLPSAYAMLPGAYLITPVTASNNPGLTLGQTGLTADDSSVVSGYYAIGGTDIRDSVTSAFIVRPGAYVNELGTYRVNTGDAVVTSLANAFDLAEPRLARDAGRLLLSPQDSLNIDGVINTTAASNGRGALVDISANKLDVVNTVTGTAGTVELLAQSLNAIGAESLYLGGVRDFIDEDVQLDVRADELVIRAGVNLTGSEFILSARDAIAIESGVNISARGSINSSDNSYVLKTRDEVITGDGNIIRALDSADSALVRVSAATDVDIDRIDETNPLGPLPNLSLLNIASGVTLNAGASILLDSTGNSSSDALYIIDDGVLNLGGSLISLGDVTGNPDGLVLNDSQLAAIDGFDLKLRSLKTVDFYGTAFLNLQNLSIDAAGLLPQGTAAVDVQISTTGNITLSNRNSRLFVDTQPGSPSLAALDIVKTSGLTLSEGTFTVAEFGPVTASISGDVTGDGDANLVVTGNGEFNLHAGTFTGLNGAVMNISAPDRDINIGSIPGAVSSVRTDSHLGGTVGIKGRTVFLDTSVDMPGGRLSLEALAGNIELGSSAFVNVSGRQIDLLDLTRIYLPGGSVDIMANAASIILGQGSQINVNSAGADSAAGRIHLSSTVGNVTVDGTLSGMAALPERAGRFSIDTSGFAGSTTLSSLNNKLTEGGFSGALDIRLREGDIIVSDTMVARKIAITADNGDITVSGVLSTVGNDGGEIRLMAADDLTLTSTALLDAAARNSVNGNGGKVVLMSSTVSSTGMMDLAAGSVIDVHGSSNGDVQLRVARTATNDGVNIAQLGAAITGADRIDIEAVQVFSPAVISGTATIDTTLIDTIRFETDMFMANADAIESSLGIAADSRYHLIPGIEVRSTGNLVLNTDWNFSVPNDPFGTPWRYGIDMDPGVLSLRAAGNITMNGNLSDGFESKFDNFFFFQANELLMDGNSWSYNLTAGASQTVAGFSADLSAIALTPVGNVTVANNRAIRTGTGDITVNAAADINLVSQGSVIYTAGRRSGFELDREKLDISPDVLFFPEGGDTVGLIKNLPTQGGDLVLNAGRDILSATENTPTQLTAEWFVRQGQIEGFGDEFFVTKVDENAGAYIKFANYTDDFDPNSVTTAFRQGVAAFGGGNATVNAGNNIVRLSVSAPTTMVLDRDTGVLTRLGAGDITVNAGNDISSGVFIVGDGHAVIQARGDFNSARNAGAANVNLHNLFGLMGGSVEINAGGDLTIESIFNPTAINASATFSEPLVFSYLPDSMTQLTSLYGDIEFKGNVENAVSGNLTGVTAAPWTSMPGTVIMNALAGDVNIKNSLGLYPAPQGSLRFYASNEFETDGQISMSDAPLSLAGSFSNIISNSGRLLDIMAPSNHASPPLHATDQQYSWIVAANGDLNGNSNLIGIPEAVTLYAGRDIINLQLRTQHMSETNFTRVLAGRDITLNKIKTDVISVSGPGVLLTQAGRNVDLGESVGIETNGNLSIPALADVGADMFVFAGVGTKGPDYAGFFNTYLDENSGTYQQASFELVMDTFYNELKLAGVAASNIQDGVDRNTDYLRGYNAISTLFPDADYAGNLNLFFSRLYTLDGGSINMMTPGGLINVGLTQSFNTTNVKKPGELGIVAQSAGEVRMFSDGDVLVNQSRVSTLAGRDIMIWSSNGNIDAGSGAKSAIAAPEPTITFDDSGNITLNFSNAIAGNGIRAISTVPGREPGDVFLFAPRGTIDAGDAGIAARNVTIDANLIIGAENISFSGVSIGVPVADTGSTISFSGVGNVASAASNVAEDAVEDETESGSDGDSAEATTLSTIEVEVLGYGEEEEELTDNESRKQHSAEQIGSIVNINPARERG